MEISSIRGYMLEEICKILLEDAGFTLIPAQKKRVVRNLSSSKVEIYGRGAMHQIDLPYEFNYHLPFLNPIQVLGEVKYHMNPISKDFIRQYIGVIKDIDENFVVSDLKNMKTLESRRLTQALYISATGFDKEAEKLAYAHNIKLITFAGNPAFTPILHYINREAESMPMSITQNNIRNHIKKLNIKQLFDSEIQSYFLATTQTGILMYFVSNDSFDFSKLRKNTWVSMDYNYDKVNEDPSNDKVENIIRLVVNGVKFFSVLPDTIFKDLNKEHQIRRNAYQTKKNYFKTMTIYKMDSEKNLMIYQLSYESANITQI